MYNELDEKAPEYLGPPRVVAPRDEEKLENIPV